MSKKKKRKRDKTYAQKILDQNVKKGDRAIVISDTTERKAESNTEDKERNHSYVCHMTH